MVTTAAVSVLLVLTPTQDRQAQCREPKRPATGTTLRMALTLDLTLLDSESAAVPHAIVRFQDAAPPLVDRDEGRIVGFTGADGRLTTKVTHEWRDYFSETRRPDSGAFDILIDAPNGEQAVRHFVVECLAPNEDGYAAQVRVLLTRRRDSIIIY
jgi:hypothetical protein